MTTPRTPGTFWRIGDRVYRIDSAGRYRDVATDIPALLSLDGRPGVELRLVEVSATEAAASQAWDAPDPREAALDRLRQQAAWRVTTVEVSPADLRLAFAALDAIATEQDTTDPADGLSEDERHGLYLILAGTRLSINDCGVVCDKIAAAVERILAARLRSARGYHWPQDEAWYVAPCSTCGYGADLCEDSGCPGFAAANPPADP